MNRIKSILCFIGLLTSPLIQASIESHFELIKREPNALYAFFKVMPKGGELHYHLAGGTYAETMLEIASENNYCLNQTTYALSEDIEKCAGVSTKNILNEPLFYEKTIKSWSLKDYIPGEETAKDHFFNSFFKFMPLVSEHSPELLAEIIKRAASQQEQYLEIMILPDNARSAHFGTLLKDTTSLEDKRKRLLANKDFQENNAYTLKESDRILKDTYNKLGCQTKPAALECRVTVKFLYYSLREQSLDNLFAQTLNAFEAVAKSQTNNSSLVGVNLVQPEDGIISLHDYQKQMQIFEYLHQVYPRVNISLHAGELTQELVPFIDLSFHIHDALFVGKAQRIGHGVAIAHEEEANKILKTMADHHIPVEINLVSNQRLLNTTGANHPLNYYLAHKVPVVLSTDDEGILRTNLTSQYVEAVLSHGLNYPTLKQINRNALTYAFLPGKSIWANASKAELVPECLHLESTACELFIKNNEKARLQWNLEQKLKVFERQF